MLKSIVKQYSNLLLHYPFLTKAFSAGILMGCSDFTAQMIEWYTKQDNTNNEIDKKPYHYDHHRTVRMVSIGFCSGGLLHHWYGFLHNRIQYTGINGVIFKVFIDQCIFSPLALVGFFTISGALGGLSKQEIKKSMEDKFFNVLLKNYTIWPMATIINFRFVPTQYQVVWTSAISYAWSVYLSSKVNEAIPSIELPPSIHKEVPSPSLNKPVP